LFRMIFSSHPFLAAVSVFLFSLSFTQLK
jgi:hypothetical protein